FPGTTVSISANNTSNGIVWAVEKVFNNASVLHAYDATTLVELYNSQQAPGSRDAFGVAGNFPTVSIANGRVYVPGPSGVIAFGLLSGTTVPNVVNLTQAAATTTITTAGLVVGTVTTAASATVPAGSVINQTPAAG